MLMNMAFIGVTSFFRVSEDRPAEQGPTSLMAAKFAELDHSAVLAPSYLLVQPTERTDEPTRSAGTSDKRVPRHASEQIAPTDQTVKKMPW